MNHLRSDARLELRAVLATARRQLRIRARYKFDTISLILISLYQGLIPSLLLSATFLVHGHPVGFTRTAGTSDVAGFLFLGAAATSFVFGAFWGVGFALRNEMMQGTLEAAWMTPTRRHALVLGYTLADFVFSCVTGIFLLLVGALFFGARYLGALALALPALVLAEVALLGVAYLIGAMALLVKEANFFTDALSFLFSTASGSAFPLSILPGALIAIPLMLPTTYALDLLRVDALHTRPLLPPLDEYGLLALLAVLLVAGGAYAFSLADRRIRRRGTLTTY
ncbi:MAG: ABC transporter permease [Candidatus Dormibacteraeota bacterium]|nr:ABC transporter permease [Candidatus Dormibacteraeota bacterium]